MNLIEEMKKALPPHVPVQRVKAWADALANSGALVPVRIECVPGEHADWYMTPTGLGWWGENKHWMPCVETPEAYHDAPPLLPRPAGADCGMGRTNKVGRQLYKWRHPK